MNVNESNARVEEAETDPNTRVEEAIEEETGTDKNTREDDTVTDSNVREDEAGNNAEETGNNAEETGFDIIAWNGGWQRGGWGRDWGNSGGQPGWDRYFREDLPWYQSRGGEEPWRPREEEEVDEEKNDN